MLDAEEILGLPTFDGLDDDQLDLVAGLFEEREIAAGASVFTEGDDPEGLYILRQGTLEVRFKIDGPDGETRLAELEPPELFGEIAFVDRSPRTATVSALEDSLLLFISTDRYQEMVADNPDIDLVVVRNIAAALAERLRAADSRLKDVYRRAAETLDPEAFADAFSSKGR